VGGPHFGPDALHELQDVVPVFGLHQEGDALGGDPEGHPGILLDETAERGPPLPVGVVPQDAKE
jgi:hypothetical protein